MIYAFLSSQIPYEKTKDSTAAIDFIHVQNVIERFEAQIGLKIN